MLEVKRGKREAVTSKLLNTAADRQISIMSPIQKKKVLLPTEFFQLEKPFSFSHKVCCHETDSRKQQFCCSECLVLNVVNG